MKDLLKKLVEIDKEAQAIDNELRKEKDNLEAEIKKEVQATKDKYMSQAQQTLDKKVASLKNDAEIKWKKTNGEYQISRTNLEKQFDENYENWVNTIVADVLS